MMLREREREKERTSERGKGKREIRKVKGGEREREDTGKHEEEGQ